MEAMYIGNGTTSIHVNPTPFLIEGLPILPFVTFGGKKKKTMLFNVPKNSHDLCHKYLLP
jgi:hypothetical protein